MYRNIGISKEEAEKGEEDNVTVGPTVCTSDVVPQIHGTNYKTNTIKFDFGIGPGGGGGGGLLGSIFAGYGLLASQSPYPIIVYFVANNRPHLSHF